MVLDVIGIAIIILFFIRGYMKGFIIAAFSVLAILLGIICSLKLSHKLADYLLCKGWVTSGWSQVISYVVLFIGVVLVVRAIANAIEAALKLAMLGMVNRLVGGILYLFLAAIVWSIFLWIFNQLHVIKPETIAASKTYSWFAPIAPWVFEHIGKVWPFAKNIFADLQHFFGNVNKTLPDHVGPLR
jgi:membrane protein required for colicin V production